VGVTRLIIDGKGEAAMYGPKIDFIAKDSHRPHSSSRNHSARFQYAKKLWSDVIPMKKVKKKMW
jgi:hypothetical protein